MNKLNKKLILPSFVVLSLIASSLYATRVYAVDSGTYPPIVQKIAGKFGLKEADVNEIFEQERAQMWQNRKQNFSERLDQAVKDQKITEEQKQKILDKKDELQANREAQRQEHREEMEKWMKDNGINSQELGSYLHLGGKGWHGRL